MTVQPLVLISPAGWVLCCLKWRGLLLWGAPLEVVLPALTGTAVWSKTVTLGICTLYCGIKACHKMFEGGLQLCTSLSPVISYCSLAFGWLFCQVQWVLSWSLSYWRFLLYFPSLPIHSHLNFPYGKVASPLGMCSLLTIGLEGWTGGINYITFPHKTDCTNWFWESACCVITLPSSWIKGNYSRKSLIHGAGGGQDLNGY